MNAAAVVVIDADLEPLIPGYMERRNEDIAALATALKDGDFSAIQGIGHNLKGSGAGYGFDDISTFGGSLEQAGKDADKDSAKSAFESLRDYLEQIELRYE